MAYYAETLGSSPCDPCCTPSLESRVANLNKRILAQKEFKTALIMFLTSPGFNHNFNSCTSPYELLGALEYEIKTASPQYEKILKELEAQENGKQSDSRYV